MTPDVPATLATRTSTSFLEELRLTLVEAAPSTRNALFEPPDATILPPGEAPVLVWVIAPPPAAFSVTLPEVAMLASIAMPALPIASRRIAEDEALEVAPPMVGLSVIR